VLRQVPGDQWEPISLGHACEVKHQIARWTAIRSGHASVGHDEYRQNRLVRHLFDWQITPLHAAIAYLERDFRGVFELEDLELTGDADVVRHRTLKTGHPHDFLPTDGSEVATRTLRDRYPDARRKFEYLAERFRRRLASPQPALFISTDARGDDVLQHLLTLLEARRNGAPTKLLMVAWEDWGLRTDDMGGRLLRAWRPPGTPDKPPKDAWQGPDAAWDGIFGELPFELQSRPAAEARSSWWSRLSQRLRLGGIS
jgi:hypothetical protein